MVKAIKEFNLRMPSSLHEALAQAAAEAHRSVNQEIVHRLTVTLLSDRTYTITESARGKRPPIGRRK
jgi:hypothetical protein